MPSTYPEPGVCTVVGKVVVPVTVTSASAPVPLPPVRGTLEYTEGAYAEPAFDISPSSAGTSKLQVASLPVALPTNAIPV